MKNTTKVNVRVLQKCHLCSILGHSKLFPRLYQLTTEFQSICDMKKHLLIIFHGTQGVYVFLTRLNFDVSKNYVRQLDLTMVKTCHPAFIITNRLVKILFDKCKLCSKVTAFVFINIIKNILYKFIFSPIKNIRKNATFHIHPFRMYPSAEAIKCAPLNSYLSQVIADGL